MKIKKHFKKLIIVLVVLMLFNFCCPQSVKARGFLGIDIPGAFSDLIFWVEKGIIRILNDIFSDEAHKFYFYNGGKHAKDVKVVVYLDPETIIKGKFLIFNANIFEDPDSINKNDYFDVGSGKDTKDDQGNNVNGIIYGRAQLRKIVAGWYYALRNFAIVALLSVLVYVGIRMIISTLAQDKAKYKMMFKDWLVALCLLIAMNFIMIGTLQVTSMIVDAIGTDGKKDTQLSNVMTMIALINNDSEEEENPEVRYRADDGKEYDIGDAFAYELVLGAIVVYTIIFAIKYLKREFTIIFLIFLGPISCITYPIDKIGDGKAQAFNKWLTEFIYQVIIQPFHLLLYIVLIGTASQMASVNVLYSIICFAVMIPAEKFIKEMFGFKDRLGSPLGNMMKAGMARDMMRSATSKIMGGKNGSNGGSSNDEKNNALPNRPATKDLDNNYLGSGKAEELQQGRDNTKDNSQQQQTKTPQIENGENGAEGSAGEFEYDPNSYNNDNFNLDFGDANGTISEGISDVAAVTAAEALDTGNISEKDSAADQMSNAQGQEQNLRRDKDNNNNYDFSQLELEESEKEGKLARAGKALKNSARHPILTAKKGINKFDNSKMGRIHAQRMLKKYGTTSRTKRWLKRGGNSLKTLAKATALGTAGIALAAGAAVTGNGAEAAAILGGTAALGLRGGMKTVRGLKNSAKDYYNNDAIPGVNKLVKNLKDGLGIESNKEFDKFESDPEQQNRAILAYRKSHDGENPNNSELKQIMRDRFALSQFSGMNNDLIDRALPEYLALKNNEGLSDNVALNRAVFRAQLSSIFSAKDFSNKNNMEQAVNSMVNTKKISNSDAIDHLQRAAKMLGANFALKLPTQTRTLDVNAKAGELPSWVGNLGINESDLTQANIKQLTKLKVKIHETGLDEGQLRLLAQGVENSRYATKVISNFENKIDKSVEYLNDKNNISDAKKFLRANGIRATKENVQSELRERLVITDRFNVKKPDDINKIRKLETVGEVSKSQRQAAREMAIKSKGKSKGEKISMKRDLINDLMKNGGSSAPQAKTDAENIMELADRYNKL